MLRLRDDLGEYARLVQELRLYSDSFHAVQGYIVMSSQQFDYVLGLVGPHISHLPIIVYVAVHVQGRTTTYDVVRRRTRCERRLTHVIERTHTDTYRQTQRIAISPDEDNKKRV